MRKQRKTPGKVVDELIANPRRIWFAHAVLGIVSAFVYWLVPGTFTPHIHRPHRGDGVIVIVQTMIAWAPYLLSGFYSTAVLSPRDSKATLTYLVCRLLLEKNTTIFYFNVF